MCCLQPGIDENFTITSNTMTTKRSAIDTNYAKEKSRREDYVKSTVPDSVSYREKKV